MVIYPTTVIKFPTQFELFESEAIIFQQKVSYYFK